MQHNSFTGTWMARWIATAILVALTSLGAQPLLATGGGPQVETLILFDPAVPETPESIVFDRFDNAYITLALTGEVRKIARNGSQSTVAFLPIGAPCGSIPTAALGLAMDEQDQLYVGVAACDPANNGLWKVDKEDGTIELLAAVPSGSALNGIDVHQGYVYAADTFGGLVWRIPKNGGLAEVWSDHPLLALPPDAIFPGPNGLRFFRGKIYVAVSATGNIVSIPIRPNGTAGIARVHATLPNGMGCDEFAFDILARIYCTTDPFNVLVRLDPNGSSHILLTVDDGLDGPTSAAFGRRGLNRRNLYITNAAFPGFTVAQRPSLMRLRLNVIGEPD